MPKLEVIRNPFLNALMYDMCYNISEDTKKTLSIFYRRILSSPLRTKNFCENSNIDSKLKFFHAIGFNNAITIIPDKVKNGAEVYSLLKKYESERLASATKDHAALRVFVTTDKETAFFMGLMGQTIHSNSFLLSLDYNKAGYHIKKWSKDIDSISHRELMESVENVEVLLTTFLEANLTMDVSKDLFGVRSEEIKILMYLCKLRHIYVTKDRLFDVFSGNMAKRLVTSCVKTLFLNGHIRKHADYKSGQYTITGLGIDLVHQYLHRVLKNKNF